MFDPTRGLARWIAQSGNHPHHPAHLKFRVPTMLNQAIQDVAVWAEFVSQATPDDHHRFRPGRMIKGTERSAL